MLCWLLFSSLRSKHYSFSYFTLVGCWLLLSILLLQLDCAMIAWLFIYADILKLLISLFSLILNIFVNLSKFFKFIHNSKTFVMAILNQGILGGISGKIGNVVGSSWKGIATLRAKALSIANPRTTKQITQRKLFATVTKFASSILATVVIPLWNRSAVRMSGYNSFVRSNIAAFGDGNFSNPSEFVLSKGKMAATTIDLSSPSNADTSIDISFDANVLDSYQQSSDMCYVLLTNLEGELLLIGSVDIIRSAGSGNLQLPRALVVGENLYFYASFLREDGTVVSSSFFTTITVAS